jgi:hypothetical protein
VKVALVEPAGIVTLCGSVAADVLPLTSVTIAPPVGARPFNVAVPVELPPPVTEVGFTPIEDSVGAFTVRVAVNAEPLVAEIITGEFAATGVVVIVKLAVRLPACTVTEGGTCAAAVFPLDRAITTPPLGATALRVTVPLDVLPPVTPVGLTVNEVSEGAAGVMVS